MGLFGFEQASGPAGPDPSQASDTLSLSQAMCCLILVFKRSYKKKTPGLQANTLYMLEFLYIIMQKFLIIGSKSDSYGSFFFFQ